MKDNNRHQPCLDSLCCHRKNFQQRIPFRSMLLPSSMTWCKLSSLQLHFKLNPSTDFSCIRCTYNSNGPPTQMHDDVDTPQVHQLSLFMASCMANMDDRF